jgi:NADH-quinone oxidoreductase subunit J
MVSSRNPVYNALWFAVVLLSSAGLFLLVGAQFLAAGTVIVYAGAIVVTFLFVIMLAQAEGHAVYDRMARSPIATTIVAFLLLGCLSLAITQVGGSAGSSAGGAATDAARLTTTGLARRAIASGDRAAALVIERAVGPTARMPIVDSDLAARGMPPPHVAGLGGTLYTDHLLAVEIVGAILFVALVGAASIATPRPTARRDRRGGGARAGSLSEL